LCEISGSHRSVEEDASILGCEIMSIGSYQCFCHNPVWVQY